MNKVIVILTSDCFFSLDVVEVQEIVMAISDRGILYPVTCLLYCNRGEGYRIGTYEADSNRQSMHTN